jgi:hypothetical protein
MFKGKRIIRAGGLAAAIALGAVIFATVPVSGAVAAEQAAAAASPKVHDLLTSLAEEWLKEQGAAQPVAAPAQHTGGSAEDYLNSAAGAIHGQIMALARAIPDLPGEFEDAAARITAIDPDSGRGQVLLDLGIFGTGTWSRPDTSQPRPRLSSTSPFSAHAALAPNGSSAG